MFALSKLLSAVATLAEALTGLAGTVTEANAALRQRLALDHAEAPLPQLPQPAGVEGRRRGRKQGD